MDYIESICSLESQLSFGFTCCIEIISRKRDNDDFRTSESESENQNPKTLDDYDEDEMVTKSSKSKKEEKTPTNSRFVQKHLFLYSHFVFIKLFGRK